MSSEERIHDSLLRKETVTTSTTESLELNNSVLDADHASQVRRKMHFLTAMAALGGFLFGYDTGVISGALLPIRRAFHLTAGQQEWVVSSTVLAALLSSLLSGGGLNAHWGRRPSILLAAAIFTLGSFLLMFAWNYESLLVGRTVVGVAIGIASLTTPLYIAEAAEPSLRGQLVTVNAFLVTLGQFTAGMVDGLWVKTEDGWRYMLGLAAIPSLMLWAGFWFLPESPRWLILQGNIDDARIILRSLRATEQEVHEEVQEIIKSLSQMNPNRSDAIVHHERETWAYGSGSSQRTFSESIQPDFVGNFAAMLRDRGARSSLLLGCGLMLIQQFSGINTVMYYAATIYEMSHFDEVTAVWLSGFTALAQVVGISLSIYLVDRMGRRTLVLTSLALVTVCLFFLGLSFYLTRVLSEAVSQTYDPCHSQPGMLWNGKTKFCYDCINIPGCGFCDGHCVQGSLTGPADLSQCPIGSEWVFEACNSPYGYMSVLAMVAYLLAFGIGMGGLPWTICSEIFPLQYRSIAISCSTGTNWFGNVIVAATFLSISSPQVLTAYGAFWMYGAVALIGFVWLHQVLPETKGMSLEEIECHFQGLHQSGYSSIADSDERERPSSNNVSRGQYLSP
ncbi:MFS transporter, SP family, solute carrier family 2 (myo-inositol transporter), member 13 [Fistulifera solaris]|uniref:Hexose transporter 1 n=1 Tax=Fistulifera solaris TaxID=1519565 RepID=A0A1Z5K8N5_FISSO|nr:MFS transporter, SP family, solute carrier family 2 (myo-inositol transporter), member 13 [Fistulifera solaris]|eukprot:GAX22643.1 MFS transporter, SP family, solute carrier family 2 (myo-inositol transporter), member 13 [Fistulifera solaris]